MFDAPQTAALAMGAFAAVPADAWENVRLVPVAAFALADFRHPVSAYLDSVRDDAGQAQAPLRRRDTWVAVYRRDYSVWRQDLTRPAYLVLSELAAGRTVGEAVAAALRLRGRHRPTEQALFRFFRDWTAAGIFMGLEGLEPSTSRL